MAALSDPPPPDYVGERLIVRRFDDRDAPFVYALHANPDLIRFIPKAAMPHLADAAAWITTVNEAASWGRGWWCVTLHDGTPVGAVVLKPIRFSAGETGDDVEIGWRSHPAHAGKGYATEAGALLLAAGFAGGLERIIAVVRPDNPASQTVARRIGMTPLGSTSRYYDTTIDLFEATSADVCSRQVAWSGLDDPGRLDSAQVLLADGLHAFGRQVTADYAAAWTVDAREGWITRSVSVAVQGRGWRRTLTLTRDPATGEWSARTHRSGRASAETAHAGIEMAQPGAADTVTLAEALDCDLGLCPLTKTMPIRRLDLHSERETEHSLTMARIDMPSLAVTASRQTYTSIDPGHVRYTRSARDFTTVLGIDRDGIVVDCPGLATGPTAPR